MKKWMNSLSMTALTFLFLGGQIYGMPAYTNHGIARGLNFIPNDTVEPESQDTTEIRFKDKKIRITEDESGKTKIYVKEDEDQGWDFDDEDWEHDWDSDDGGFNWKNEFDFNDDEGFDVHWSGLEIGLNNYVNNDFSMSLAESNRYMELNTGKSWNVNLNLLEYDLNLIGQRFGFGTGLGLEFNDYRFDNQLTVQKGPGYIAVDSSYKQKGYNLEKGKLSTTYLRVPIILEYQVEVSDDHKLFIGAGILGGMKLGSHSKVVYRDNGDKNKDKNRSDFYLNPFRYGYTARIGYGFMKIFANYYDTPLFEKDKGPELHPFSIGFLLSF